MTVIKIKTYINAGFQYVMDALTVGQPTNAVEAFLSDGYQ